MFSSDGFTLNGTFKSSQLGTLDISAACFTPAYAQVALGKREESQAYVVKLGLERTSFVVGIDKTPLNSIYETCPAHSHQKKVAMASAALYTPSLLQLKAFYDLSQIDTFAVGLLRFYRPF